MSGWPWPGGWVPGWPYGDAAAAPGWAGAPPLSGYGADMGGYQGGYPGAYEGGYPAAYGLQAGFPLPMAAAPPPPPPLPPPPSMPPPPHLPRGSGAEPQRGRQQRGRRQRERNGRRSAAAQRPWRTVEVQRPVQRPAAEPSAGQHSQPPSPGSLSPHSAAWAAQATSTAVEPTEAEPTAGQPPAPAALQLRVESGVGGPTADGTKRTLRMGERQQQPKQPQQQQQQQQPQRQRQPLQQYEAQARKYQVISAEERAAAAAAAAAAAGLPPEAAAAAVAGLSAAAKAAASKPAAAVPASLDVADSGSSEVGRAQDAPSGTSLARGRRPGKVPPHGLLIAAATAAAAQISGAVEHPAADGPPCQPLVPGGTTGCGTDAQVGEPQPPWWSRQASPAPPQPQMGATQQPAPPGREQGQQVATAAGTAGAPLPQMEPPLQQPGQDEGAAAPQGAQPPTEQQLGLLEQEAPACRAVLGSLFVGRGQLEQGLAAVERLLLGECLGLGSPCFGGSA